MEQEILNTVVLIFAHGEIIPEVVTLTSDTINKMSYHENIKKNTAKNESNLDDLNLDDIFDFDLSTGDLDAVLPPPNKKQRIGGARKRYREASSSKFINNNKLFYIEKCNVASYNCFNMQSENDQRNLLNKVTDQIKKEGLNFPKPGTLESLKNIDELYKECSSARKWINEKFYGNEEERLNVIDWWDGICQDSTDIDDDSAINTCRERINKYCKGLDYFYKSWKFQPKNNTEQIRFLNKIYNFDHDNTILLYSYSSNEKARQFDSTEWKLLFFNVSGEKSTYDIIKKIDSNMYKKSNIKHKITIIDTSCSIKDSILPKGPILTKDSKCHSDLCDILNDGKKLIRYGGISKRKKYKSKKKRKSKKNRTSKKRISQKRNIK